MNLSERQLNLIQAAAEILITELKLTHVEVLEIISTSIKKELKRQNITMGVLNYRERSERAKFIRHVVHDVHFQLSGKKVWTELQLEGTIKKFMEALHNSWETEMNE